jgi:hypothetical protein
MFGNVFRETLSHRWGHSSLNISQVGKGGLPPPFVRQYSRSRLFTSLKAAA